MSVHIIGVHFSALVRAVLLCCEEKNIPYSSGMTFQEQPIALRTDALKALNPMGKIPVLVHDEFILSETQSILRYLDNQFTGASLQGTNPKHKAQIDQWCAVFNHQSDLILVRQYLLEFAFPKGENGQVRMDVVDEATPAVEAHLKILSQVLGNRLFWVGEAFSLADCLLLPILDYLESLPHSTQLFSQAENLIAYVQHLRLRPSARKILTKREKQ